jgi:phosphatidylglycerophosphate synthase
LPVLCIIGTSAIGLWSHGTAERLAIQFARAGLSRRIDRAQIAEHQGPLILVRADAVLDQPLIPILLARPNLVILGDGPDGKRPVACHVLQDSRDDGVQLLEGLGREAPARLEICSPGDLDAAFWPQLRKREVPYALIVDNRNKQEVEWRTFMGTYKGATDVITKRLWPIPAFHVTRALASTPITPNLVTTLAALLVFIACYFFLRGDYAVGLAAAWLMTFLDTVDGKLARTTLTSSKWGDIFDHGLDLVHPPFWYIAWAIGLEHAGFLLGGDVFRWLVGVILAGYVLQRLMEGIAIKWLGMEIHIWRPIDTQFREITARRNPNLVLLTLSVIMGRPDLGLMAVAAWTAICFVLHAVQLLQAFVAKERDGRIGSWMHDPANTK